MARWSRIASSLTVTALVLASFLVVLVVNSSSLVSPPLAAGGNGSGPGTPQGGILRVTLQTNQKGDWFATPGPFTYWVSQKPVVVADITNLASAAVVLFTNSTGSAETRLSAGSYLVRIDEWTLHLAYPVKVTNGEETRLSVTVTGTQYHVNYSEISATGSSPLAGQNVVFLQVRSSHPVANVNDTVVLKVMGGATPGAIANATVIESRQSGNISWLQLVTPDKFDAAGASSMAVVVYRASSPFPNTSPMRDLPPLAGS